jgi:hypothetical protein
MRPAWLHPSPPQTLQLEKSARNGVLFIRRTCRRIGKMRASVFIDFNPRCLWHRGPLGTIEGLSCSCSRRAVLV